MKALVGTFNQEKALAGAFSVIVQPVVEPMEHYTAPVGIILWYLQSMPKMPEGEKKEESAESLAEKKEQVSKIGFV